MQARSELLATALKRSWRASVPPLELTEQELAIIAPLLVGSGAGGLVWRRIRQTELRTSPFGIDLRQTYREQVLRHAVREAEIEDVLARMRTAGIEPLLVKGWGVARLYPESGLRPLGDIDLYVLPEHRASAEAMGYTWGNAAQVDLQDLAYAREKERTWERIYARSQLVRLGETALRIPCPEDHLALICLHFLSHGGWRPLWLCDVAVALESRSADFDWTRCLGSDRRRADWIACTIGLARRLLGAEVAETPISWRAQHLPTWLVPAVLRQWETPCYADHPVLLEPISANLRYPARLPLALRKRWPDPIRATFRAGAPFNELPRWPFQAAAYCSQLGEYLWRLRSRSPYLAETASQVE
jgi:hypothetical protein